MSCFVGKIDALRWTQFMEDSLRLLAETKESPSDMLLVMLVRIQLIMERIKNAPWNDVSSDAATSVKAPASFYLKALKQQLEDVKKEIPGELRDHGKAICSASSRQNTDLF